MASARGATKWCESGRRQKFQVFSPDPSFRRKAKNAALLHIFALQIASDTSYRISLICFC
jgi:hypothetical protein